MDVVLRLQIADDEGFQNSLQHLQLMLFDIGYAGAERNVMKGAYDFDVPSELKDGVTRILSGSGTVEEIGDES